MRDLEKMLQGLGEENQKAEKEASAMTELEKKRILAKTMEKIEIEKKNEEKEKTSRRWKMAGKVAAAALAVVLVGTAGTKAAAALGIDNGIRNLFGIETKEESRKVEKLISTPEATATSNGVTISTSQAIGDHTRFYVMLKAKNLPDVSGDITFQNIGLSVKGDKGENYDYTIDGPTLCGIDGDITRLSLLISGINKDGYDVDINEKSIALTLKNVGYENEKGKFVTVKKGTWKLNWTFHTDAEVTTKEVNKNISLLDAKAKWKDIRISPLSVTVDYQITKSGKPHMSVKEFNKLEKTQRVIVQFADGTREDSRFSENIDEDWGDEKEPGYRRIGFRKVIEPKDVVSVTFGGQTVVLNAGAKLEKRTQLRSKAANCSIALPKEVARLITVKEKKHVKNADFKKMESYASFVAKKHGVTMTLFTVHKIKGEFSENQVGKKNPMMIYIGCRDGYTYTVDYAEIQDDKQAKEFTDIMNKYVSNLLPYFEFIR